MKSLAELRTDALAIFQAGLQSADPLEAVKRHVAVKNSTLEIDGRKYALSSFDRVFVVGAGKASAKMAQAIEGILGDRLKGGVVNVKYDHSAPLRIVKINEAGHPLPDDAGVKGTQEIVSLLRNTGEKDMVLCLLSGGGSALLPCPAEGLTLQDKQLTTKVFLDCGATIHEVNAVRKHISQVKGGRLARLAHPSVLASLILSDVIGDDLDSIASGPTVPDRSTFGDCMKIFEKYGVIEKAPQTVVEFLRRGMRGEIEETPKAQDPIFNGVQNTIVGSNRLAIKAAKEKADSLGYHSFVLSSFIEGETREAAKFHAAIAKEIVRSGSPVPQPACVISGGETTVTIQGRGLGGRNQEFALAAATAIAGLQNVLVLSGGTDGTDGPTDAAGAIADGGTTERARNMGLSADRFLKDNDSYRFFQPLGDLLMTGPTLTNVMDLRLVMVG